MTQTSVGFIHRQRRRPERTTPIVAYCMPWTDRRWHEDDDNDFAFPDEVMLELLILHTPQSVTLFRYHFLIQTLLAQWFRQKLSWHCCRDRNTTYRELRLPWLSFEECPRENRLKSHSLPKPVVATVMYTLLELVRECIKFSAQITDTPPSRRPPLRVFLHAAMHVYIYTRTMQLVWYLKLNVTYR